MARQHFYADGEYLGWRTIPSFRIVPGLEVHWHHSYALYCIRCGEIWGRFLHEGAEYTQLIQTPCRKHGNGLMSCHPAWIDMPTRFEHDWPLAATKREFDILLTEALKQLETKEVETA